MGDNNEGEEKDGQGGDCENGGAGKKGNNLRDNAKHVRIRQPADGDAGAAGRTEQEGEEPEDQQGRGLLRAKAAKAKAKATAKAAVGETDKDRAGRQKTNKGLTDKGRATAFSVSEQVCLSASQLV